MSYQILVVDGNPRLCNLIRDVLAEERKGDTVSVANSASDALMMMRRKPADILVTDWQVPDMDGLALIEAVQRLRPKTHAILMTTADEGEVKERGRNCPASYKWFAKPFSIDEFLTHVDHVLKQSGPSAIVVKPDIKRATFETVQGNSGENASRSKSALRPALSWH